MKPTILVYLVSGVFFAAGCKSDKKSSEKQTGPAEAKPGEQVEYWSGAVTTSVGQMELGVVLKTKGDSLSGVVGIPVKKIKDLELRDVVRDGGTIKFTIAPPGYPESAWGFVAVTVKEDGKAAEGTMTIEGDALPLKLEKVANAAALPKVPEEPKRPQTPNPPFPYAARDVVYDNPAESCKLAGTLTIPKGNGRHPAVLLITGSGAQDRDSTIFGHKPFLVIADYLTRRGVAVLRVDDRGIGKTTCKPDTATVEAYATDVEAGVAFLKKQKEVDPAKIGLMGHSEGGFVAPLVASKSKEIAFVITLAGPGVSGGELIPMQLRLMLEGEKKLPAKAIDAAVAQQEKVMEAIKNGADIDTLQKLVRESLEIMAEHVPELAKLSKEELDAAAAAKRKEVGNAWFASFVKYDPREVWPKVKCPALALFGGKDFQVPAAVNLKVIAKAHASGGNKDLTVKKFAGLNHLFQLAGTGLLDEYAVLEETFNPDVLAVIAEWLKEKGFGTGK